MRREIEGLQQQLQSIERSCPGSGAKEVCGGSKAIWPTQARRRVATGKAAQRRRLFILIGVGGLMALKGLLIALHHALHALRVASRATQIRVALAGCGVCLGLAALYHGGSLLSHSLPFVIFLLVYLLAVLGTVLFWFEHYYQRQRQKRRHIRPVVTPVRSVSSDLHNSIPGSQLGHALRSMARQTVLNVVPHSRQGDTSSFPFPETPVPATPLIRILETVDLSSSNIAHFLDTTSFRALASPLPTPVSENTERKQRRSSQE